MIFNNLYKSLLDNVSKSNYVTQLLDDPTNRFQEALFILFSALNLNEKINVSEGNFKISLDGFNTGESSGVTLDELGLHNIKGGGSASDCTFIRQNDDEKWEMICISAKDYKEMIGVKSFETSDIYVNLKSHYQEYKIQRVGIICREKDKISIPNKSSLEYQKIIDSTLIFDNSDLIRWWQEKFCKRVLPESLSKFEPQPFKLRLHQEYTVSRTKSLIKSNPELAVLWGHIPRSGKSFMIAALIHDYVSNDNENKLFAIVCAIPNETKPQYEDIFKSYRGFENIHVINSTTTTKPKLKKGKNVLLFSRQFFTNKKESSKLEWVRNEVFEYLFIDEAHFAGTTDLSNIIFTYFFNKATRIYVTASFRKPQAKYEIEKNRIIIWRQEDIHLCKTLNLKSSRKKLIEFHDHPGSNFFALTLKKFNADKDFASIKEVYEKFPELELITWRIDKDFKEHLVRQQDDESQEGWSIDALLNRKGDQFENLQEIIDVFSRIFGTGNHVNKSTAFLNRCHQIASIRHRTKTKHNLNLSKMRWFDNNDPKIILCFLPMNKSNIFGIKELSRRLKKLLEDNSVCPDFFIKCINSGSNKSAKLEVARAKNYVRNQKKYKGILLLLGRQLQMGVSLPKADFVLMLDNSQNFDNIYQKMFRCLTEDTEKNVGFCIDLNIHRVISFANNEMWSAQDANLYQNNNELAASVKQHRSYKFDQTRFITRLININSDQYTNRDNLAINEKDLRSMINKMNKMYVESILTATAKINDTNSVLSSFFRKNDDYVLAAKEGKSQLLQDLNDIFTKTPYNGSQASKDVDFPTGISEEILEGTDKHETNSTRKKVKAKINYARDIFPPLVILMCLLTIREDKLDDFQKMSDYINDRFEYKQHLLTQINLWWSQIMNTEFNGKTPFTNLVKLYHESFNNDVFNKWIICYKSCLAELHQVDKQKELSMLIDETFKPSKYEKKNFAAIMTPRDLRQKMLDLMPSEFWKNPSNKVFEPCCGKGGFVVDIIERFMKGLEEIIPDKTRRYRHIVEKQIYFSDIIQINTWLTRIMLDPAGKSYKLNWYLGDATKLDIYEKWKIQNFDAIITNPPFNDDSDNFGSGHEVWPEFIQKFITWLRNYSGLLLTVCPNKWRHLNSINSVKKVKLTLREFYIRKIVFCGIDKGEKYFKCSTKFDYFLLQKIHRYKKSNVIDEQGKNYDINLSKFNVIPNANINKYYQLLRFDGGGVQNEQNNINFVYSRSSYETRKIKSKNGIKPLMSKKQTSEYKHSVISTLNKRKQKVIFYTHDNTKKTWNGKSFLVPKVIFTQGSGMEMATIDAKGEYLLTEYAYGIGGDNKEELESIWSVVRCEEFRKFTQSLSSSFIVNKQIFKYLRKDFYKYINKK